MHFVYGWNKLTHQFWVKPQKPDKGLSQVSRNKSMQMGLFCKDLYLVGTGLPKGPLLAGPCRCSLALHAECLRSHPWHCQLKAFKWKNLARDLGERPSVWVDNTEKDWPVVWFRKKQLHAYCMLVENFADCLNSNNWPWLNLADAPIFVVTFL